MVRRKTVHKRISIELHEQIKKVSKELDINDILASKFIAAEPKFKIVQLPKSKKIELIQIKKLITRRGKKK